MLSTQDMRILDILAGDARISVERIAVMLGAAPADIAAAIARMEKERVIVKYPAMINWDLTSQELVEAVVEVRVTPQRDAGFDAIAARIYRFDEVKSVYLMSGAYDLMVVMTARSMKQLAYFVAEKLSTIENVQSTATHFVLKKYKADGVIFEEKRQDTRQAVSP